MAVREDEEIAVSPIFSMLLPPPSGPVPVVVTAAARDSLSAGCAEKALTAGGLTEEEDDAGVTEAVVGLAGVAE